MDGLGTGMLTGMFGQRSAAYAVPRAVLLTLVGKLM